MRKELNITGQDKKGLGYYNYIPHGGFLCLFSMNNDKELRWRPETVFR